MADSHVVTNSPIQTATATLHTNRGDIKVALFGNHAPKTVANFVGLAQGTKEYSTQNCIGWPVRPVLRWRRFSPGDPGLHDPGRRPDRHRPRRPGLQVRRRIPPRAAIRQAVPAGDGQRGPGTNGSQFFITVGQTPHLNRRHTIFGEVIDPESQKVVDAIATTATDGNDRPTDAVVIESITIS